MLLVLFFSNNNQDVYNKGTERDDGDFVLLWCPKKETKTLNQTTRTGGWLDDVFVCRMRAPLYCLWVRSFFVFLVVVLSAKKHEEHKIGTYVVRLS